MSQDEVAEQKGETKMSQNEVLEQAKGLLKRERKNRKPTNNEILEQDKVLEMVEGQLKREGQNRKFTNREVLEQISEKYGEQDLHTGVVPQQLEGVFDAVSTENVDLDEIIQDLQEQLDGAHSRKHDGLVILGTLKWLAENIFNETASRDAIRDAFDQKDSNYSELLNRLGALQASSYFDEKGRFIPRVERYLDPEKFSGVTEEKEVFRCSKCKLGFRDKDDLKRHVESGCGYEGEEAFFQKRDGVEFPKKLYCDICKFTAKNEGGLASHRRSKAHKKRVATRKALKAKIEKSKRMKRGKEKKNG